MVNTYNLLSSDDIDVEVIDYGKKGGQQLRITVYRDCHFFEEYFIPMEVLRGDFNEDEPK